MTLNKKDLVYFYSRARLESEGARFYVGYLWWILDPALSVLVYYVVFQLMLHRGRPDYIPFLFVGMIAWKWFQTSTQKASMSIYQEKKLYRQVYLPKDIFPWIEVTFHTVKFLAIFSAMVLVYLPMGYPFSRLYFLLPILILAQYLFLIGSNMLLASLTPFFPDFSMTLGHILRLLFYPSGVVFSLDTIPQKYHFLVYLNPMAQFIEGYRNIILYQKMPNVSGIGITLAFSGVMYLLGTFIIRKLDRKYAKLVQ